MQGQRGGLGSLSEALNFEHGSTSSNAVIDQQIRWNNLHDIGDNDLQDYLMSAGDASITYTNSIYHEQRDLNRFSLGEPSSSGTTNEVSHDEQKTEHGQNDSEANPLFVQRSISNRVPQNLNLNSDFIGHGEESNQVMEHHANLYESNGPVNERVSPARAFEETSGRPGSSLEGRRASCKRKALESSIGQSSSSSGCYTDFQRGESSSWAAGSGYYNAGNGLNISGSLGQGPRGLTPGTIADFPVPVIPESSHRNFRVRINPSNQQESINPAMFSAGSVMRQPVIPPLPHTSRLLPVDHPLELRSGPALVNTVSQNQNAPIHVPATPRNMQPLRWNGGPSPSILGGSSSSTVSIDRDAVQREAVRSRGLSRHILDNPLFIPAPELRNLARNPTSRSLVGGSINLPGNAGPSSSRVGSSTGVQPATNPTLVPPNNNAPPHYSRRLSELVRRSLLSTLAAEPGNPRPDQPTHRSAPPASSEEVVLPSGASSSQGHSRAYRTASWLERQGDNAVGIPHSLRVLASTSRGRSRLVASEIRNVLDLMRRGENVRFEDVMLLDHSVFLGVADIHDRYRDMRLDVDNMSYEELLALEERIGDVCTGLSEENISNRLKKRKYTSTDGSQQEAEPCCVCQEEYNEGEDLGTLECGHDFHTDCIKQWLKRKNLCPICKTTGLNTTEKPTG